MSDCSELVRWLNKYAEHLARPQIAEAAQAIERLKAELAEANKKLEYYLSPDEAAAQQEHVLIEPKRELAEARAKIERLNAVIRPDYLGEGVHTAFRKGSDGKAAGQIWKAIKAMPPEEWSELVNWLSWSLAYSAGADLEALAAPAPQEDAE